MMAGLLDSLDDPQTAGLLSLGLRLMSTPGSFGTALGKSGLGALDDIQQQRAQGMQRKLQGAQLDDITQQALLRKQQAARQQNAMDMAMRLMTPDLQGQAQGQPQQPPQMPQGLPSMMTGSGQRTQGQNAQFQGWINQQMQPAPQAPQQAPQGQPQGLSSIPPPGVLSRMSVDQITGLIASGALPEKAYDAWKFAKVGEQMQPGYQRTADGRLVYNPDPTKGITLGPDGSVQQMPGAAAALSGMAGATKTAELRATNANTLAPADRIMQNGKPFAGTTQQLIDFTQDPMNQLDPALATRIRASMARDGVSSARLAINTPGGAVTGMTGGGVGGVFQGPADAAAEKLRAEQGVHAETDPLVAFNKDRLVSAHANVQKTYEQLQDTIRNEAELQNRNAQILPMLQKIQTGGFAPEARISLANSLQTSNLIPDSAKGALARWVANGDPSTGKVIENQLASAGIKTMLDTLDKEGKPNRAIFQALQNAQESVKSGNATLQQVFGLQKQLYEWHMQQEQSIGGAMAAPDYNPIKLQSQLSSMRNAALQSAAPAAPKATLRFNPKTGSLEPVN